MTTSVIIPFRPDSPERYDALLWVKRQWQEQTDWEVIVAHDSHDGPWCKARSIQRGVDQADGDIFVIADADCWCGAGNARLAVQHAEGEWASWAVPHRRVIRLDMESTKRIIAGTLSEDDATFEEQPYTALNAAGGIVALTRELWNRVPMDPRFLGWGFEDTSWWAALRTLDSPAWRGTADLFHLWHPRSEPGDRTERSLNANPANRQLADLYTAARYRPGPMGALVSEAKAAMRPVAGR